MLAQALEHGEAWGDAVTNAGVLFSAFSAGGSQAAAFLAATAASVSLGGCGPISSTVAGEACFD